MIAKLFKGPQDLFSTEKVAIVSGVWESHKVAMVSGVWGSHKVALWCLVCGEAIRLLAKLFLEVCSAAAARSDPEIIYCKESGGRGGGKGEGEEKGAEGERQKRVTVFH